MLEFINTYEKGFNTPTPQPEKSLSFRMTRVKLCTAAVPTISLSACVLGCPQVKDALDKPATSGAGSDQAFEVSPWATVHRHSKQGSFSRYY